jgi:DNA replication protein DnaC
LKHSEWLRRQRARELRDIPIPHEHRDKTLEDVRVHEGNAAAIELVRTWLTQAPDYLLPTSPEAGKGLLLCGPPGTGKTLIASVIANALVRRAMHIGTVHFTSMEGFNRNRLRKMELGQLFGQSIPDDSLWEEWRTHDLAIEKCYDVRLLVLDDVGQENTTEHLAKLVNELLRARYGRGLPTVITSNVEPWNWATRFKNVSLASFIHQACFLLPFYGEDARAVG